MIRICKRREARGFTLIEMMIVISLVLILISIALPVYNRAILRSKESVLKQDLFTLRQVIDQYTMDKKKAPQALDDIVSAGYLKVVPKDPFTNEANWTLVQEEADQAVDQQEPGIIDVHSASEATATDGTTYSSW
jgi:general secretion pathway protein G